MANISIKKDFEDGQKLFAQQLNNNFETIEFGVNAGNKLIWKDDNGAEFQTFRGTTEEIENRPIIDGQKLYDIENGDTFLDVGETRKVMNKPLWKDDNGAQVQSFRGTAAEVAARPIIDGQTLYNIETGETALDVGDKRISTGAGNVVYIGDEEPQNDATKIWIEKDQVLNLGSEVAISSEEPTTQEKVWIQRGKNLFDTRLLTQGGWNNPNNSERVVWGIKVKAGTTYTLTNYSSRRVSIFETSNLEQSSSSNSVLVEHGAIDGQGNLTFTTKNNAYLRLLFSNIDNSNILVNDIISSNIQLEQGEVATSYEPYTPKKIHTNTGNGYEEFYNEENREVYSTGETRIGTYLGKPLYRKVIQGVLDGTYTENGLFYSWLSLNVGHLGTVTDLRVSAPSIKTEGRVYTSSGSSSVINCCVSGTAIQVGASIDHFNNQTVANAIIEYTKTTD